MDLVHSCLFERIRYRHMKNALHMLIGDFEAPGLACENFEAKSRLSESQSAWCFHCLDCYVMIFNKVKFIGKSVHGVNRAIFDQLELE